MLSEAISDGLTHEHVVGTLCCDGAASRSSRVTVENAYLEEKEDACNALGEIAAQTG